MKHEEITAQFLDCLANLSRQVEVSGAVGHFNIHKICENLACGLFRELYGLNSIRNLNAEEKANFPGIDLADDDAKVAVQVTADKSLNKIKESLVKIVKFGLHKKYDKIIFYILVGKQVNYSMESIRKVCPEADISIEIIDYKDMARKGVNAHPANLQKSLGLIKSYMEGEISYSSDEDFDPPESPSETLATNLVKVSFPGKIYIAEVLPEILKSKKIQNQRKAVADFSRKEGIKIPSDFVVTEKRLITFHNLENSNNPFYHLIDRGNIEYLSTSDFFRAHENYLPIFKSLLKFCLQQKIFRHRVVWEHRVNRFVFLPMQDYQNERVVRWTGKKTASRTVFLRKFSTKDPQKVYNNKHLSFFASFAILNDEWYMSITPDWHVSYEDHRTQDIYMPSRYAFESVSRLKRMEKNRSVYNQVRFLCAWLNNLDKTELLTKMEQRHEHISFKSILECEGGRYLDEELWQPVAVRGEDEHEQGVLDFYED